MPKTTKSSKKKKYNARFPPARIKKIMQTDEEVGKVAAAVPVIISRALELFIESLISETAKLTQLKNAKTLSTSHIKQTIKNTRQFDFLHDLVKNIPDHQPEENNGDPAPNGDGSLRKGKGRPRKSDSVHHGRKKGERGTKSSSDEDEEDDEEDVSEDTETDEESAVGRTSSQMPSSLSHQGFGPLPSSSEGLLSSNNNNNNNINHALAVAGPASHGLPTMQSPLAPGQGTMPGFHPKDLPLSPQISKSDNHYAPNHLQQPAQPFFQPPPSFNPSTNFPPFMAPQGSFVHCVPHGSQGHPSNPVVASSCQQQQPMDLRKPLPQRSRKGDDDYDS